MHLSPQTLTQSAGGVCGSRRPISWLLVWIPIYMYSIVWSVSPRPYLLISYRAAYIIATCIVPLEGQCKGKCLL